MKKTIISLFLSLVIISSSSVFQYTASASTDSERISGTNFIGDAIAVSEKGWTSSDSVLLANVEEFPDSMAGVTFASLIGAPILLTHKNALDSLPLDEIKRLNAKNVYLLGGTGALSADIENSLRDEGLNTIRLAGLDRFQTAVAIGEEIVKKGKPLDTAFIAYANNFPDALSAATFAAQKGYPILFTDTGALNGDTASALRNWGIKKAFILGGTGVVSPVVESTLNGMGISTERLGGDDRYDTGMKILKKFDTGSSGLSITSGEDFPDALVGSVFAAKENAPIMIYDRGAASSTVEQYIRDRVKDKNMYIIGGLSSVPEDDMHALLTGSIPGNTDKTIFIPDNGAKAYAVSDWAKELADSYKLTWYEEPARNVTKGEFLWVHLKAMQASLERRGLAQLSAPDEKLDFKDIDTLSEKQKEDLKILKSLGMISADSKGSLNLSKPITQEEAAIILYNENLNFLKILYWNMHEGFYTNVEEQSKEDTMIRCAGYAGLLRGFTEAKGGFKPNANLTIEQTLKMLDNQIYKYSSTEKSDIAKAIARSFKATVNPELLKTKDTNTYANYETKMNALALNNFYSNKTAKSDEYVTKAEALKMAVAVTLNIYNINNIANPSNEYPDATWTGFAESAKITDEDITANNYNEKVKYIDVITYFERCKMKYLHELQVKDTDVKFKDISKYSSEQQAAVKDMVANGILTILPEILNGNDYATKAQVNEIAVNYAQKYNTIALEGDVINTDPGKMPLNAVIYPYILANVDNKVYDTLIQEYFYRDYRSPIEVYQTRSADFYQIADVTERYFDCLLNVDYRTITEDDMFSVLNDTVIDGYKMPRIKEYVQYVKDNEIIIEGKAKFQAPILYWTGLSYRPRVRLEFEIKHSKTKENVLFLDKYYGYKTIYEKTKYDVISDYYLSTCMGVTDLFVRDYTIYPTLLNKEDTGIIQGEKQEY